MHRPKTERQALAKRLLGTADEPGPLDVGWIKRRYGVEGSHIKRWREDGIPAARVDDLEAAILELAAKDAHSGQPEWAEDMERRILDAIADLPTVLELARSVADEAERERDGQPHGGGSGSPVARDHGPG